jgi:Gpi18-like mannosyltransferase
VDALDDGWLARSLHVARFGALLLVGLVIRLVVVNVPGHNGDTSIMVGWAEYLAANGGADFYRDAGSIYPALLYVLWPLGIWLDDPQLGLALKALSIPFDLALATLVALITARLVSTGAAYGAAALYLFNPAVLLAGPIWGQVDAAGTLFLVAALVAASNERHATAGALAVVAGLFKPQFGLVVLPVLAVAVLRAVRERRPMPILRTVLAGAVVYAVLAWPIGLDPLRYAEELRRITANQPMTSLLAFNPWGLLIGFEKPDGGLVVVGGILLVLGLAASLVPLLRRRDLAALLAVGACLAFAVYFLPTRAHDRYLFPAVAVLAPLAVVNGRRLVAYLVLSVAFALALVYALATITPFPLPEPMREVVVTAPSVWAIGLVLMASAVVWVLLFTTGEWRRARVPAAPRPGPRRG